MSWKIRSLVAVILCSLTTMSLPRPASAEVALKQAVIRDLRNTVELILKNQQPRRASKNDTMTPGDALKTAQRSLAELRFNDRSLARVGERTLFRFVPNTRTFRLTNGTVLLLIPPGKGRTRIETPNAAAGIRGSALFIRHTEGTNTTLVGALTNSQIEVFNQDGSQSQVLRAGQLAVVVQNRIERIYNFDLKQFYQTSEMVRDLDLPMQGSQANPDPDIALVQAETSEAVRSQTPIVMVGNNPNPFAVSPTQTRSASPSVTPVSGDPIPDGLTGPDTSVRQPRIPRPSIPSVPPVSPSPQPPPAPPTGGFSVEPPPVVTPGPGIVVPDPVPNPGPRPDPGPGTVSPIAPPSGSIGAPSPAPVVTPPAPAPAPAPAPVVTPPVVTPPAPAPAPVVTPPVVTPPAPAPSPAPVVTPPVVTPPAPAPAPAPVVTPPVVTPPAPAPAPVVTPPAPAPAPAPRPDPGPASVPTPVPATVPTAAPAPTQLTVPSTTPASTPAAQ